MSLTPETLKQWAKSYKSSLSDQLISVNELKDMHEQLGTKIFLKHLSKVPYITDQNGMDFVNQLMEGKI
jgi:hypothetical protein